MHKVKVTTGAIRQVSSVITEDNWRVNVVAPVLLVSDLNEAPYIKKEVITYKKSVWRNGGYE